MRMGSLSRCASVLAGACAVLCASAALSFCQASVPSAKDLAARVDRHYNELHSLKAGFSERYEGIGIHRTESGTLLLKSRGE